MYEDQAIKLLTDMLDVIDDIWAVKGFQVSNKNPYRNPFELLYPIPGEPSCDRVTSDVIKRNDPNLDLTTPIEIISKALQRCFSHQVTATFTVIPSYVAWYWDWEQWENEMGEKIPDDRHGDESPWEYAIRTQFASQMHYTFSNYNTVLYFKFIYNPHGYAKILSNLRPRPSTLLGYVRDWMGRNPAMMHPGIQDGIPEHLRVSQQLPDVCQDSPPRFSFGCPDGCQDNPPGFSFSFGV